MPVEELLVLDQFLAGVLEREEARVALTSHGTGRRLRPSLEYREVSEPQVTGGRPTRSRLHRGPSRCE